MNLKEKARLLSLENRKELLPQGQKDFYWRLIEGTAKKGDTSLYIQIEKGDTLTKDWFVSEGFTVYDAKDELIEVRWDK